MHQVCHCCCLSHCASVISATPLQVFRLHLCVSRGSSAGYSLFTLAGNSVRERLVFEDSLVGSQHIVNSSGIPEQACHVSLAFTPDRLLLLASQGQHMSHQPLCLSHVTLSLSYHIPPVLFTKTEGYSCRSCIGIKPRVFTSACHFLHYLHVDILLTWGTPAGVRSARMLSWQERLASLRDLLLWDHALWLGLRIYTVARPDLAQVCPLPFSCHFYFAACHSLV